MTHHERDIALARQLDVHAHAAPTDEWPSRAEALLMDAAKTIRSLIEAAEASDRDCSAPVRRGDAVIVLVCGGRDFADHRLVGRVLDEAHSWRRITRIVTGCAAGADRFARNWALSLEVDVHVYAAKWSTEGRKAGPIRNARMLEEARPDLVIAFPGGRGTADMIRRAVSAGVPIVDVEADGAPILWQTLLREVPR